MSAETLISALTRHRNSFHPVVPFDPAADRLFRFDFTAGNTALNPALIADTDRFAGYINRTLEEHKAKYGIGGYGEHRTLYGRSQHFDEQLRTLGSEETATAVGSQRPESVPEPRRLHLGIDIWGPAGTRVMAPLDGIVHSFAFNNRDSDYGATLILTHHLDGVGFHTLYGHLSLNSLKNLFEGKNISRGEVIAEFGMRFENGNWPPHLHFQIIVDMEDWKGDYPGVAAFSQRGLWLDRCPDPDLLLNMMLMAK